MFNKFDKALNGHHKYIIMEPQLTMVMDHGSSKNTPSENTSVYIRHSCWFLFQPNKSTQSGHQLSED